MEIAVAFTSAGRLIRGILAEPDAGPKAAVVLIHGWSGCRTGPHRILVESARELARRGFAALRFDLGGRGESDGDWRDCGLDEMIEDTAAAVGFVRDRYPAAPVVLWGMCSGGNVALGTAAMRPDCARVVAWSTLPFQTHRTISADARRTGGMVREYLRKLLRAETWRKLAAGRVNFRMVLSALFGHFRRKKGGPAARNLKDSRRDIMRELEQYTGRILFLNGGADAEARSGRALYEAFCAEHHIAAAFDEVAGANHDFYSLDWKREAIAKSADWVEQAVAEGQGREGC